ncbi:MAG: inositol monophosphatase family protein [Pseudomonadota bacterium]
MDIDISAITDSVIAAGNVCRRVQSEMVSADTVEKKDRSPVTVADYAAQAVICRTLSSVCPDIPVVAEEGTENLRLPSQEYMRRRLRRFLPDWSETEILAAIDRGSRSPGTRFFTLDPIDGTKGFLRGGQYAQALALIENGRVVMGWLGCPNLDGTKGGAPGVVLTAERGAGGIAAGFDGAPLGPLKIADAGNDTPVRFLESVESGHSNHALQERVFSHFGDQGKILRVDSQVKYAMLGLGRGDIYLRLPAPASPDYREKIWDHAAGALMVETAGGVVSDAGGRALDFTCGRQLLKNRGIVAASEAYHARVMAVLGSQFRG